MICVLSEEVPSTQMPSHEMMASPSVRGGSFLWGEPTLGRFLLGLRSPLTFSVPAIPALFRESFKTADSYPCLGEEITLYLGKDNFHIVTEEVLIRGDRKKKTSSWKCSLHQRGAQ